MNRKELVTKALLVFMIFGLTSCFDDGEQPFDAEADVYYINKLVDGEWVHGTTYYVYGNQTMSSATVTTPVSLESIELQPAAGFFNVMVDSPAEEDYSANAPEEGNFVFEITSAKGEVLNSSDAQEFVNLEGAKIDSIGFDDSNFIMTITWNEIPDCDGYYVKLYDTSDNLIFEGYGVPNDVTEFNVSEYNNTGVWNADPVNGDEYEILLQTFVYDDDATQADFSYNIKEVTVRDTTVVWDL